MKTEIINTPDLDSQIELKKITCRFFPLTTVSQASNIKSNLLDEIKLDFFQALSTLLYGCITWTLTKHKKRWELHKDTGCSPEHILETALHKIRCIPTSVASYKPNAMYCWRTKDELINNVLFGALTHERVSVDWTANIPLDQLEADIECSLEDQQGAMDNWNGYRERQRDRERQRQRGSKKILRAISVVW